MSKLRIRRIDPLYPQPDLIREAASIIKKGGVVAFPTRSLYGLGADAFCKSAVEKIFAMKRRSHDKPILIFINRKCELARFVRYIPPVALHLMEVFWPGKITIIFKASDIVPINLTAGTGKIGIRLPEHPVALAIADAVKYPVTGTSANLSENRGCSSISELDSRIEEKLDLILDAGSLKGGIGSTVVDVTGDYPKILREGKISAGDINSAIARHARRIFI